MESDYGQLSAALAFVSVDRYASGGVDVPGRPVPALTSFVTGSLKSPKPSDVNFNQLRLGYIKSKFSKRILVLEHIFKI